MPEPIMNDRLARFHSVKNSTIRELEASGRYHSARNPNGCVPIISIEHDTMSEHHAGVVFEATIPVAARSIAKRTHREATEEEYKSFLRARDNPKDEEADQRAEAFVPSYSSAKVSGKKQPADPAKV